MRKSGVYFNSSYEEQILQLIKLGLLVYDRKKMLKDLSNKKMLPYLWYFKHEDKDGRCFSSVRWEDVRRLHDFDMELRLLLMSSVNEVEISFREKFAYFMEREFGCFWQYREGMFKKPKVIGIPCVRISNIGLSAIAWEGSARSVISWIRSVGESVTVFFPALALRCTG